jgi:multidrug efflux system membrane fusion protein
MIQENPTLGPPLAEPQPKRPALTRLILLAALVVLVAGIAWIFRERSKAAATAAAAASSAAANRITPVLTADAVRRDVPVWVEGLGNVSAFYTVTVKTQVDGRIDRVLFKEGQSVKKGDVLVQIDPRPFAIQLESAQAAMVRDQANLKNARLNLERYKTLVQQQLIAVQQMTDQQATVDQLDAQVRADQAQIDSARLNLDYARIKSPIDGVTGVRLVDPGNVVHASDAGGLVVVTQLDPIAVYFTLPEDDLAAIHQAMAQASLDVDALSRGGDKSLGTGKLSVIDNEINQQTATLRLKAIFDNPARLLWPNAFVKARLFLSTRKDVLVVPAAAVQHGPQGTFAYVVAPDSTAVMKPVVVEATQGELAVIASGLSPGDHVVVDGQAQLRPGARVAARPAAATSAAPSAGPPGPSAPQPLPPAAPFPAPPASARP